MLSLSKYRAGRTITLAMLVLAGLSGCATSGNPQDPLETFNRSMFKFNDAIDEHALKPAATVYKEALPSFVQTGVNNFFGNLSDIWSSANNLMQGKGEAGMIDLTRFTLNSTFGLAGLLDIASEAGLQKHNEDFGQTLGYWGVPSGPYLMLPLLGPSTLRDTAAMPLDMAAYPWAYKTPEHVRNLGTAVRIIDKRAVYLDATNLMEEAALDRYVFVRDSFLQRRENQVFDGETSRRDAINARNDEDTGSFSASYDDYEEAPAPLPEAATEPAATPDSAPMPAPVSSEPASK